MAMTRSWLTLSCLASAAGVLLVSASSVNAEVRSLTFNLEWDSKVAVVARRVRAQGALQTLLDELAFLHNTSFSVGLASPKLGGALSVVAGLNDRRTGDPLTTAARIPVGSVTKSFTASQVMQAHERGLIDIEAPIYQYVDPVLSRLNGTTMLQLWNNNPMILNVSTKDLMGMRSGLQDYNDTAYAAWTWANPDGDWTPFDILHALDKTFVCPPGECGVYSSVGFELLGLALVQVTNVTNWWDLDQFAVIPPTLRSKYTGVSFPEKGRCSLDKKISHQYRMVATTPKDPSAPVSVAFSDIVDYSCLNGWSCGNIAISTQDTAQWYYDLLNGAIVSNASLSTMLQGHPLTSGWSPGLKYGLGLSWYHYPEDPDNLTVAVGHGGSDYGSLGHLAGYNIRFGFGLAVAATSVSGMNCSEEYRQRYPVVPGAVYNEMFYSRDVSCRVYDTVLQVITDGKATRLNCSKPLGSPRPQAGPPPTPACTAELDKACAAVKADPTVCKKCTAGVSFPDCTKAQIEGYCPNTPPPPQATSDFTCHFDF